MKKWMIRISVITIMLAGVLGIALMSSAKLRMPYRYYSFVKMPPLVEHFVAGELTDGKVIEQRLVISPDILAVDIPGESSCCVGVLTATYSDRKNKGSVRFRVQDPDGHILWKDVSFNELKDNRYHKVCFDLPFHQLRPGDYIVRLEGLGGKSGSSATVWLTKYLKPPFHTTAFVDGKPAEGVLVAGFLARQYSPIIELPFVLLIASYFFTIAVLMFVLLWRKNPSDSE